MSHKKKKTFFIVLSYLNITANMSMCTTLTVTDNQPSFCILSEDHEKVKIVDRILKKMQLNESCRICLNNNFSSNFLNYRYGILRK